MYTRILIRWEWLLITWQGNFFKWLKNSRKLLFRWCNEIKWIGSFFKLKSFENKINDIAHSIFSYFLFASSLSSLFFFCCCCWTCSRAARTASLSTSTPGKSRRTSRRNWGSCNEAAKESEVACSSVVYDERKRNEISIQLINLWWLSISCRRFFFHFNIIYFWLWHRHLNS